MERFPVEPLIEKVGSVREVLNRARCSGLTFKQAERDGLTFAQADRWAIRCGSHPSGVWPEWWDVPDGPEQLDLFDEVSA